MVQKHQDRHQHQDSHEESTTKPIPLRRLKRFGMGPQILIKFYICAIKSITAWYGNCSASDRKALQRVVRTAQYITGAKLSAIQDLYTRQCQRTFLKMVKVSSHPTHRLFSLLLHGSGTRALLRCCYSVYYLCIVTLTISCLEPRSASGTPRQQRMKLQIQMKRDLISNLSNTQVLGTILKIQFSLIQPQCLISKVLYSESSTNDYVRSPPTHRKTQPFFPAKERSHKKHK